MLPQSLGDDDEGGVESSSAALMETEEGFQPVFFDPRPLTNLELLDRLDSLAPITDMKVANLANEEIPQIYAACGRGARSTLRVLRPGLAVTGGCWGAGAAAGAFVRRLVGQHAVRVQLRLEAMQISLLFLCACLAACVPL